MKITQGTFGYLPDLTDEEIEAQLRFVISNGCAVSIELTDDPHFRNTYWEMWGLPMFDLSDPAGVMSELQACRAAFPHHYVRLNAFDSRRGRETIVLSFLVQRPESEPGFRLERQQAPGRTVRYTTTAYALDRPSGERYA